MVIKDRNNIYWMKLYNYIIENRMNINDHD